MTDVGFPDFQEQAQWQSPIALNETVHANAGATVLRGPFNVSAWQTCSIVTAATGGAGRVTFAYYADEALTIPLASVPLNMNGNSGEMTVTNKGPWLLLGFTAGGAAAIDFATKMTFSNRSGPAFNPSFSIPLLQVESINVLAGTSQSFNAAYAYGGPAFWWGYLTGAASAVVSINLEQSDETLVWHFLAQARADDPNAAAGWRQPIVIPPRNLRVTFVNLSGIDRTFWTVVTPDVFR